MAWFLRGLLALVLVCAAAPAAPQFNGCKAGFCGVAGGNGGGGGGSCAQSTAFIARTSGLDATHTNAYHALICGLVSDGVWAKLDMLHVYATQDSTTALLNLVSTSYTGQIVVATPGITFTADRGFTGTASTNSATINTQFSPSAGGSQFTQNSAHISVWVVDNFSTNNDGPMGMHNSGYEINIHPWHASDNAAYFRANDNGSNDSVAVSSSNGLSVANRVNSTTIEGYRNASKIFTNAAQASVAPVAGNIRTMGNDFGGNGFSSPYQVASASIGAGLTATDEANLYARQRTFMTTVGVP